MARGWESKSVEDQIELAESRRELSAAEQATLVERRRQRELEGLERTHSRVERELASATHPRHREMIEAALRRLEEKIAALAT